MDHFIINPQTKKPVKIGSQTYNRLVRSKMIGGTVVNRSKKAGRCIVSVHQSRIDAYKAKQELERTKPASNGKMYSLAPDGLSIVLKNKKIKHPMIQKLMELAQDNVEKRIVEILEKSDNGDLPLSQFRKLIFQELITIPEGHIISNDTVKQNKYQTVVYNNADTSTETSSVSGFESGSDEDSDTETVLTADTADTTDTADTKDTIW